VFVTTGTSPTFAPVCDNDWGEKEAMVACRQLGYTYGHPTCCSEYGSVPGDFAMDNMHCTGQESSLQECFYHENGNCETSQGAGVQCF
jgi:hypothetical protein